jgi:RNA polymerase sigma-70 factor (ECF subfamily)
MDNKELLADQFEANRPHLQGVAFRMLGSLSEADDAVQEAWFRLNRSDASSIENLGGWLTTVVARVCLDMLRARKARREASLETDVPDSQISRDQGIDPEQEAVMADSVGLALLVVLETLAPAERLAFVLHDIFALPFEEIAPIVERTPTAARQLASRARRRVQGADMVVNADLSRQRQVVDAFLAAARKGDFNALLSVLDPEVVMRTDPAWWHGSAPLEMQGAAEVANRAARGGARAAQPALVNGSVGVIVAPRGRLMMVIAFTIIDDKIVAMEAISDPERLAQLDLAILSN